MNTQRGNAVQLVCGFMLACIFLFSCKKNETLPPADLKKEYFPLKPGTSITYKVDSTVYNDFNSSITKYAFELKDTVVTEMNSENGSYTVQIERYKKKPNEKWQFQKMITRTLTGIRAEEFIDNRRYVRLTFPPQVNNSWNGNSFNNLEKQLYFYKSVDKASEINNSTFDSTLVVVQIDDENLIRQDYAEETYARNIGLVKKTVTALDLDFDTQKIVRGYSYTMQIKSED